MTSNLPDDIDVAHSVHRGRAHRERRKTLFAASLAMGAAAVLVSGGLAMAQPGQRATASAAATPSASPSPTNTVTSRATSDREIVPAGQRVQLGDGITMSVQDTRFCLQGLPAYRSGGMSEYCAKVDDTRHGGPLTPSRVADSSNPYFDYEISTKNFSLIMGVVSGEPAKVTHTDVDGVERPMTFIAYPGQKGWSAYVLAIANGERGSRQQYPDGDQSLTSYDSRGVVLGHDTLSAEPIAPTPSVTPTA